MNSTRVQKTWRFCTMLLVWWYVRMGVSRWGSNIHISLPVCRCKKGYLCNSVVSFVSSSACNRWFVQHHGRRNFKMASADMELCSCRERVCVQLNWHMLFIVLKEASHSQVPFFPRVSTSMHIPIFEKPVDERGLYRQARTLFIIYETSSSAVLIEERGPIKLVHRFF